MTLLPFFFFSYVVVVVVAVFLFRRFLHLSSMRSSSALLEIPPASVVVQTPSSCFALEMPCPSTCS